MGVDFSNAKGKTISGNKAVAASGIDSVIHSKAIKMRVRIVSQPSFERLSGLNWVSIKKSETAIAMTASFQFNLKRFTLIFPFAGDYNAMHQISNISQMICLDKGL